MMENSTILIVDDNQEIREIIEILLTGEGISGGAGERRHDGAGTVKRAGI